jgi:type VI protein secretion system component Hcp
MFSTLNYSSGRRHATTSAPARKAIPRFESLEGRSLMSRVTTGMYVPAVHAQSAMAVSSYSLANTNPPSTGTTTRPTENIPFRVTFTTTAGAWSTGFGKRALTGEAIPQATLFVETHQGMPLISWHLTDVRVVSDHYSANSAGGLPIETVVLDYESIYESFKGSNRGPKIPPISDGHTSSHDGSSQFGFSAGRNQLL